MALEIYHFLNAFPLAAQVDFAECAMSNHCRQGYQ